MSSYTEGLMLNVDAGSRHLARDDLYTTSGGIADGKDIIVGLLRCVPLPNGIKIDVIIVLDD